MIVYKKRCSLELSGKGRPMNRQENAQRKEEFVHNLFDHIAERYDFMNMVMTGGMIRCWYNKAVAEADCRAGEKWLDACCGTGEMSLLMASRLGEEGTVWGLDFSDSMLRQARRKVRRRGLEERIHFKQGNALEMPWGDATFDGVITGFALRNVADVRKLFAEMYRVTVPGGRLVSVEISRPRHDLTKWILQMHLGRVVPLLGKWAEGSWGDEKTTPYRWLSVSRSEIPDQDALAELLEDVGFCDVELTELFDGVVSIHRGIKPF